MRSNLLFRFLLALGCGAALNVSAYELLRDGQAMIKWSGSTVPFQVRLGTTPTLQDGTNYSSSVVAALDAWNAVIRDLQLSGAISTAAAGANSDGVNQMFFSSSTYGQAWGSSTIAVTTTITGGQLPDGTRRRTEADVLFNSGKTWNSYRGALQGGTLDIRRVALHELGHALGLDHPDESGQTVTAIMNSRVSDVDALQRDDLDGVQRLYGVPGVSIAPANDNFANATAISLPGNNTVTLTGSSVNASKETGEPNHASGEAGGASVWWKWTATGNGTLVISTDRSNFDTLLGAYTGSAVGSLTQIASNDDIDPATNNSSPTRNRRSLVTIPVTASTTYYFAVDGWQAEWGSVVLTLTFTPTDPLAAPAFTAHPLSQTVNVGASVNFTMAVTGNPSPTFQWFKNGNAIADATGSILSLTNLQTSDAGNYTVRATNSQGSATSNTATLTVNATVTTPSTPSSSGGGGGGGGAPSEWFFAALALAGIARRLTRRQ